MMDRRSFLTLCGSLPLYGVTDGIYLKNNTPKDIILHMKDLNLLYNIRNKMKLVQRYVGYGNFNYIPFDSVLFWAKRVSKIGAFTKDELDLLDMLYYDDPKRFGFFGAKTTDSITTKIKSKDIIKIPRTGHYLFRGKPQKDYNRLVKDVGKDIILTSGVRGIPKQMYLYINKIIRLEGNISQASKIIAPPAYTYHAISDFDVGKKGFGVANFSERFTTTNEYKKLIKLDYVSIRYMKNNKDGVRYEPWHIEVI